ncbi:UNVERIFIED_CONTAM: hypothetical protein RKD50_009608 [Streptomyces canus]
MKSGHEIANHSGTTRSSPTSPRPDPLPAAAHQRGDQGRHGQGADTVPPAVRRDRRQGTGGHHPLPRGRVEVRLPHSCTKTHPSREVPNMSQWTASWVVKRSGRRSLGPRPSRHRVTALTAATLVAALCPPATQAHQETPRHSGGAAGGTHRRNPCRRRTQRRSIRLRRLTDVLKRTGGHDDPRGHRRRPGHGALGLRRAAVRAERHRRRRRGPARPARHRGLPLHPPIPMLCSWTSACRSWTDCRLPAAARPAARRRPPPEGAHADYFFAVPQGDR